MKTNHYNNVSLEVVEAIERLRPAFDDYHTTHLARLARTAQVIVDTVPRGECRLLEVGTSGFIPAVLSLIAPDVSVAVTKFAEAGTGGHTRYKSNFSDVTIDVECFEGDLEFDSLSWENCTFDVVVCCEVLEHMEIDPMWMLWELNRVTKHLGNLVLTTPNIASSRGIYKILHGYPPYFYMQYHKSREYNRHNYEYTVDAITKLMKAAGYKSTVWTEDLFEDGLESFVLQLSAAGFPVNDTGDNIIAVCTKLGSILERYPSDLYV